MFSIFKNISEEKKSQNYAYEDLSWDGSVETLFSYCNQILGPHFMWLFFKRATAHLFFEGTDYSTKYIIFH